MYVQLIPSGFFVLKSSLFLNVFLICSTPSTSRAVMTRICFRASKHSPTKSISFWSHVRQKYEKYVSSGEINFEVDTTDAFLNNLTVYYVKQNPDLLDGVTVDFGSWWFNVRSSKTEALVRLNMEAENRQLFKEKLTDIMAVLQELGAREKKG